MGLTTDYQLGQLEEAIMAIVWQRDGEVTVREVHDELKASRPIAYTTVMTVMSRLVPKGVLAVRRQGKADFYRATGTPEELRHHQAQRAVQDLLAHFGEAAVQQFVREVKQSGAVPLQTLRTLLDTEAKDAH